MIGTGIVPSGSIANELTAVTRRAFVPKLVVQLYNSTPLLAALLSNSESRLLLVMVAAPAAARYARAVSL